MLLGMEKDYIQSQIDACTRCIEIGGPTPEGYEFIQPLGLHLPQKIIVTNISNPIVINPLGDSPETYVVDEVADINNLPYEDGSIDMLLASSLPKSLREKLIREASRVLRTGGLFLIQNQLEPDEKYALQIGFMPLLDSESAKKYYSQIYQWRKN